MPYNTRIPPREYSKTYGGIPGEIDLPSLLADLEAINPQIKAQFDAALNTAASQRAGELDPTTLAQLQDDAARWGLASGTPTAPGSLGAARGFWNNVRSREQQKQLGMENVNKLVNLAKDTMTIDPGLQAQIAERNATMASAPVPEAAVSQAKKDYMDYLRQMNNMVGGRTPFTRVNQGMPGLGGGYGGPGGRRAPGFIDPGGSDVVVGRGTMDYGSAPKQQGGSSYTDWRSPSNFSGGGTTAGNAGSLAGYIGSVLGGLNVGSVDAMSGLPGQPTSTGEQFGPYSWQSPVDYGGGAGGGYYDTPTITPPANPAGNEDLAYYDWMYGG